MIQLLAAPGFNLCAVGDDDQAIYAFRGADLNGILRFQERYPNAKIVRMEQNYRSTRSIIEAVRRAIHANVRRHPKSIFTENPPGEPVEEIRHEKREVQAVSEAREETVEKETGGMLEPGAEAVGKKSEGDPLPAPARTPGSEEILKRCPSRKVLYRGRTYKTAGINADQLKRIWDAARGPDAERARKLLERFGLSKSVNLMTYLRENEADEMIKALGTQPLSNGHPAEMPV